MIGLVLAAALATTACPVERAQYQLRDDPAVSAGFVAVASGPAWPSQLALRLHSARSGRAYWFLPWNGGSDGRQHLASTTDVNAAGWQPPSPDGGTRPLGDIEYLGTDADYRLLDQVPVAGGAAPAHLLLPDLREALWYRAAPTQREHIARQFFDLLGCRR